ncbi:creatininase family protein [Candidatus Palauibacter polyketidifaciens]|uniref:creatininase family protein n=1 Tax=Candidatus Palauibacter polyketidifaciens TaxID=3056740 RepID=UPI002395F7ED|nr:creatininase family protein [Candidatus Palauibacter polyketidifaciens]MDE2720069.1 creatininase family protein [Candidatus Palauibacter polyketidifaciens]
MTLYRLSDLTWEEFGALDLDRTVAILPVGATEAHGPHLPLDTDVIIAEAMAEAGARRLSARGLETVLLDGLRYTPAAFAANFPGTIDIGTATFTALVVDIAASLGRAGIATLAIANAHFDPAHVETLRAAAAAVGEGDAIRVVFPDVTRRPWGSRLTEEFRSGACHAGQYEGSIVLARSPGCVRMEIMRELEDNPVSLSAAIGAGLGDFAEAGGTRAYFGYPSQATAEEGRATIETLGDILAEAVSAALEEEKES